MTCEETVRGRTEYLVYVILTIISLSIVAVGIRTVLKSSEVSLKAMEEAFISEEKVEVSMKVLNVIPSPVAFVEYENATFSFVNHAFTELIRAYDIGLIGRPVEGIVEKSRRKEVGDKISDMKSKFWSREFATTHRMTSELERDDGTVVECDLIKLSEEIRGQRFWVIIIDLTSIKEIE